MAQRNTRCVLVLTCVVVVTLLIVAVATSSQMFSLPPSSALYPEDPKGGKCSMLRRWDNTNLHCTFVTVILQTGQCLDGQEWTCLKLTSQKKDHDYETHCTV
jgi:hypothetical protein